MNHDAILLLHRERLFGVERRFNLEILHSFLTKNIPLFFLHTEKKKKKETVLSCPESEYHKTKNNIIIIKNILSIE